jgi:hypothetical protein
MTTQFDRSINNQPRPLPTPQPDLTIAKTRNADTKANFLLWYKDVFGFSALMATCLY